MSKYTRLSSQIRGLVPQRAITHEVNPKPGVVLYESSVIGLNISGQGIVVVANGSGKRFLHLELPRALPGSIIDLGIIRWVRIKDQIIDKKDSIPIPDIPLIHAKLLPSPKKKFFAQPVSIVEASPWQVSSKCSHYSTRVEYDYTGEASIERKVGAPVGVRFRDLRVPDTKAIPTLKPTWQSKVRVGKLTERGWNIIGCEECQFQDLSRSAQVTEKETVLNSIFSDIFERRKRLLITKNINAPIELLESVKRDTRHGLGVNANIQKKLLGIKDTSPGSDPLDKIKNTIKTLEDNDIRYLDMSKYKNIRNNSEELNSINSDKSTLPFLHEEYPDIPFSPEMKISSKDWYEKTFITFKVKKIDNTIKLFLNKSSIEITACLKLHPLIMSAANIARTAIEKALIDIFDERTGNTGLEHIDIYILYHHQLISPANYLINANYTNNDLSNSMIKEPLVNKVDNSHLFNNKIYSDNLTLNDWIQKNSSNNMKTHYSNINGLSVIDSDSKELVKNISRDIEIDNNQENNVLSMSNIFSENQKLTPHNLKTSSIGNLLKKSKLSDKNNVSKSSNIPDFNTDKNSQINNIKYKQTSQISSTPHSANSLNMNRFYLYSCNKINSLKSNSGDNEDTNIPKLLLRFRFSLPDGPDKYLETKILKVHKQIKNDMFYSEGVLEILLANEFRSKTQATTALWSISSEEHLSKTMDIKYLPQLHIKNVGIVPINFQPEFEISTVNMIQNINHDLLNDISFWLNSQLPLEESARVFVFNPIGDPITSTLITTLLKDRSVDLFIKQNKISFDLNVLAAIGCENIGKLVNMNSKVLPEIKNEVLELQKIYCKKNLESFNTTNINITALPENTDTIIGANSVLEKGCTEITSLDILIISTKSIGKKNILRERISLINLMQPAGILYISTDPRQLRAVLNELDNYFCTIRVITFDTEPHKMNWTSIVWLQRRAKPIFSN